MFSSDRYLVDNRHLNFMKIINHITQAYEISPMNTLKYESNLLIGPEGYYIYDQNVCSSIHFCITLITSKV